MSVEPLEPGEGSAEEAEHRLLASLTHRRALADAVLARWQSVPHGDATARSSAGWDAVQYFWWRRMSPFWAMRRQRRPAWPVSLRDEPSEPEPTVSAPASPRPQTIWERIRAIFAPAQRTDRDSSSSSKVRVIQSAAKNLSYVGLRQLAETPAINAPPAKPASLPVGPSAPESTGVSTPLDMIAPLSLRVFDQMDQFLTKGAVLATTDEHRAAPSRLFWWPELGRLTPSVSSAAPASSATSPRVITQEAAHTEPPTAAAQEPFEPVPETAAPAPEPVTLAWPPLTPPQGAVRVVYEGIHIGRRRPRGLASAEGSEHTAPIADQPVLTQPPSTVSLMPPPAAPLPPPSEPGLLGRSLQHHAIVRNQAQGRMHLLAGVEMSRGWASDHVIRPDDLKISAPATTEAPAFEVPAPAASEPTDAIDQPSWLTRVFHPRSPRTSGAVDAASTSASKTEAAPPRGRASTPVGGGASSPVGSGASPTHALRRPVPHGSSDVSEAAGEPSLLTRVLHALPRRPATSSPAGLSATSTDPRHVPSRGERRASPPVGGGESTSVGNPRSAVPVREAAVLPQGGMTKAGAPEPTAPIGTLSWLPRVFRPRPRRPAVSAATDVAGSPATRGTTRSGGEHGTSPSASRREATSAVGGAPTSARPEASTSADHGGSAPDQNGESTFAGHGESTSAERGRPTFTDRPVAKSADRGASTSAEGGVSASASHGESTSAGHGESTSARRGLSTSVGRGELTSAGQGESASAGQGESASAGQNEAASAEGGVATSAKGGESRSADGGVSASAARGESASAGHDEATSGERRVSTSAEGGVATSADGGSTSITGSSVPVHEEMRDVVAFDDGAAASRASAEVGVASGWPSWLTRVFHPRRGRLSTTASGATDPRTTGEHGASTSVRTVDDVTAPGQRASQAQVARDRASDTAPGGPMPRGASGLSVAIGQPSWLTRVLRADPRRAATSGALLHAGPAAGPSVGAAPANADRAALDSTGDVLTSVGGHVEPRSAVLEGAAQSEPPPQAWLTRVLHPRPKRVPVDVGGMVGRPAQTAAANGGSPSVAAQRPIAPGSTQPWMAVGRRRDEPRTSESADEGEPSNRTDAGAERQAALAEILARLPEAMAAPALAAGVLESATTVGATHGVAEPAGPRPVTAAYAPVDMVSSPGRRRGSTADGATAAPGGTALTSGSGATRSATAAMSGGMAASSGGAVATGASGGGVASGGGTGSAALQRTMSTSESAGSLIQRELGEPGAASTVDVDALADEVFTRLRWRLSAERERTFG
jgi:hypothetical protein